PITSSAVKTAARVVSEIPGRPFRTRLTVASLTPACLATSESLPGTLQAYVRSVQDCDSRQLCSALLQERRGRDVRLAADPVDEERDLVDVAPVPVFAGLERADDRVRRRMCVRTGMAVG